METTKYERRTFYVEAVKVEAENLTEVANWCNGLVVGANKPEEAYVKVPVSKPLNDRQTMAMIGDWVLKNGKTFKIYSNRAFVECFQEVPKTKPLPIKK